MENHTYNLTTEEPRYTADTVPKVYGPARQTRREMWYPAGEWKHYKKPWVNNMPAESLEALLLDHFQNDSDAAAYDFIVAKSAFRNFSDGFGEMPLLWPCDIDRDYTIKKASGAAYAREDRGDWNDEERMIVPHGKAELPPWYLRVPLAYYDWHHIIEPRFSGPVTQALIDEHVALESMEAGYDCAVAAEALGVDGDDLHKGLSYGKTLTTSSGNLIDRKPKHGGVRAMPYNEKDCGMSEECLIALEQHFLDLEQDDCDYGREVCEWEVKTKLSFDLPFAERVWHQGSFEDVVSNAFGPSKHDRYNENEQEVEQMINDKREFKLKLLTEFRGVNLLTLSVNAQAATYYPNLIPVNPPVIVAKFEHVDISTIPAENMTCIVCLDDFEEAEHNEADVDEAKYDKAEYDWSDSDESDSDESDDDDSDDDDSDDDNSDDDDSHDDEAEDDESDDEDWSDDDGSDDSEAEDDESDDDESDDDESDDDEAKPRKIKLSNGKVRFDNSPVKIPCPHGHLIGKTCLMQLIDAKIWTCPMCRREFYTRGKDPRVRLPGLPAGGVDTDHMIEQYAVWD